MPESRHVMLFAMVRPATNLGTAIGPVLGAALVMVSCQLLLRGEALATLCLALAVFFALRGGASASRTPRRGRPARRRPAAVRRCCSTAATSARPTPSTGWAARPDR
ncbi:hypothetical protein [Streptomyces sp. BE230]|uniref:hypothetical protein n=1 Tax=Streptomyces sp. BE230 TaxID=3002526 RepID=UPI002ED2D243|nr:hypothetical protein [Streptomyces sp. BE230]